MENLLLDIDSSFFDHVLTPDPTPKKKRKSIGYGYERLETEYVSTGSARRAELAVTPVKKKSRTLMKLMSTALIQ